MRLNIPPLTEERRRELVKLVHKRMEEAKVEIRNHRREAVDDIRRREKDGARSAPTRRTASSRPWSSATHRWIDEVDRVGAAKEQEVLEV